METEPRRDAQSPKNADAFVEWIVGGGKFVAQMAGSRDLRGFMYAHEAIKWLTDQGAKRIEWK